MSTAIVTQSSPNELLQLAEFSERVCKANLLPDHLKNKPADCLLIAMQAQRWRMDFFAVAQCTSIVRGKPMYEGKLVAAAINASGKLTAPLNHRFSGDSPPKLTVTIIGKLAGEDTPREWEVPWDEGFKHAQDKGQWNASPKKRLLYFATREWARVHMPEVMLGVVADDEQLPTSEAPASSGVTMPTSEEVTVREVTPKTEDIHPEPQPKNREIEAEVVTEKPADPEIELLTDFLTIVRETKEAKDLTHAVNEQVNTFKNPAHVQTAKKAINKRSKELGLVWDVASKSFKPLA